MLSQAIKRAHTYWLILRALLTTFKYSVLTLYHSSHSSRRSLSQIIYRWANSLLNIVQAKVIIHNPHHVTLDSSQATFLMSNHNSLYDIPLIFKAFPQHDIRMIAKKELFSVPILGRAMQASEFLSIDRNDSKQAMQDLEKVRAKLDDGIVPWIAPEGTRSRDGQLGVFKKGGFMLAIQTQALIVPLTIRGADNILPAKTFKLSTGKTVHIFIGKPIDASQYDIKTRMNLLTAVRQQIVNDLAQELPPD